MPSCLKEVEQPQQTLLRPLRTADIQQGRYLLLLQKVSQSCQLVMLCLFFPLSKRPRSLVEDDQMILSLVFVALVLMLTRLFDPGNTQTNGKKSPIKLIRNNTNTKESNGSKPPSPATVRPSTAIDPLSHVRSLESWDES